MSQQVVIELPDEAYRALAAEATAAGKSVAELAAERVAAGAAPKPGDLLRSVRGIVAGGPADGSVRHHEYLADTFRD